MKRVLVIALAIVCGMACSDCFAKKPKKQEVDPQQAYRDSVAMVEELQKLEEEMRIKEEMYEMKKQAAREELNRSLMDEMEMPCQEEAKSTDEYYGAWAVSDGQMNQSYAVQDAMHKARFELAKQVGGEDTITLTYEVVCQQIMRDKYGNFIAYVAVRMPKNK